MCSFLYQHSSRLKEADGVGNCGNARRGENVQKIGAPADAWLIASTDMGERRNGIGKRRHQRPRLVQLG